MSTPLPNPETLARLRETELFRQLPAAALEQLARIVSVREVAAAQNIFERNSPGDEFFLVLKGTVELIIPTHPTVPEDPLRDVLLENATDAVVDTRDLDEFFDEIACLAEAGTRTASAHAPRGCNLLVIPKEPFLRILRDSPNASLAVLRQLADRLRWHTDHLARLVRPGDRDELAQQHRTAWEAFSDWARKRSTSVWFTVGNLALWAVWLGFNGSRPAQDLPTINGLTLWVSLQAILMMILVLVSEMGAEAQAKMREETQFTNTTVSVEQTTVILHKLVQHEADLRQDRLKAKLREQRQPAPQP